MKKTKIVGLNLGGYRKELLKAAKEEQTRRLVEYAKVKIIEIGNTISTAPSANHMDRTGNLLDSLCWGVSYEGRLVDGGFYRNKRASRHSYLHEWFSGDVKYLEPVDGRELASKYLETYGNNGARGWRVFFAILAPYWGYWEKGFRFRMNPKNPDAGHGFLQFAVMTQFYDKVKNDLKPARTRFRVSVPKYEQPKLEKRWHRYSGL